ncbi:type II toxin-antitoxin system HipA family toxin [Alkalimonas delamerensis]|uniref:Type II toxin-antitoxin system HipA family toxin n=1 Tax=Alkalimonas delamerensis TaxID=265981 RepID=A0ABT9GTU2_9GAMM|nr:type II toxin-antitoxin system HipA family toxin [Alkalimonas delamerensis]MDP4530389.1 type II toxin-antitoxin system HipA family toxin [Alkalimonas delamerensis]
MDRLDVYMNGIRVGEYQRDSRGANAFIYDTDWLCSPGRRSLSLSLTLRPERYAGPEVYNFFDNLLPDSHEIRERMVARFKASSTEPFDILKQVGRDCVGAIQLMPSGADVPAIKRIEASALTDAEIAKILNGYQSKKPLGMLDDTQDFRISLAGAQEKTALLFHQGHWCLPHNATPTTHILKLPIGEIRSHDRVIDMTHSVENEYLCLKIAKAYGFKAANCQMIVPDGVKALAVERFDRTMSPDNSWIMRLPQEDFCQVKGISPARKYEPDGGPGISDIMQELLGATNPKHDRETFMRTQVLFWLLGATDGHAKNFSIFIERQDHYRLTPLYDILSAFPALSKKGRHDKNLRLAMSLKGSKGRKTECRLIGPKHFFATANEVGFPQSTMEQILHDMGTRTAAVINQVAAELPADFPGFIADPIFEGMHRYSQRLLG